MIRALTHLLYVSLPVHLLPQHLIPHTDIFLYWSDTLIDFLLSQPWLHMRILIVPVYLWPILHQLYILLFYRLLSLPLLFDSHLRPFFGFLFDLLFLCEVNILGLGCDLWGESGTVGVLKLCEVVLSLELVLEHAVVEISSYLSSLTRTQWLFFTNWLVVYGFSL
jgi:hypothetical protein